MDGTTNNASGDINSELFLARQAADVANTASGIATRILDISRGAMDETMSADDMWMELREWANELYQDTLPLVGALGIDTEPPAAAYTVEVSMSNGGVVHADFHCHVCGIYHDLEDAVEYGELGHDADGNQTWTCSLCGFDVAKAAELHREAHQE